MKANRLIRFDWAIKTILRNKVNFPILEGFLSELIRSQVTIKSLLESESNKKSADEKLNRVDILAELADGERVIIEVQCQSQHDFFSRMLFGVSRVVVEHLKEGDEYGKIPRVISVNIVYFHFGQGNDYIYHGTTQFKGIHQHDTLLLNEKEKEHYHDRLNTIEKIFPEYYVLRVGEFDLTIKDTLDEWMYALKESEVKSEFRAQGIKEAGKKLDFLNLSGEERLRYEAYVANERNTQSTIQSAFIDGKFEGKAEGLAEGEAKGKAKGLAEAKAEIIKKMHSSGLSIQQISQMLEMDQTLCFSSCLDYVGSYNFCSKIVM